MLSEQLLSIWIIKILKVSYHILIIILFCFLFCTFIINLITLFVFSHLFSVSLQIDQIHKSNTSTNSTFMNETENSSSTIVNSLSIPEFILNLTASSSFVSNCTDVEFYCEILLPSKSIPDNVNNQINSSTIWWTFRGQNVSSSTLPGGRVINRPDNLYLSILNIECAQFGVHDGDYSCHSSSSSSLSSSTEISGSQQQFSIITNSSNLHFEISGKLLFISFNVFPLICK